MNLAVSNLPTSDLSVAKSFCVEKLGSGVIFESTQDGNSGLIGPERDGMRINLDSPMDGHGRQCCVSLEVEDIDALYREWSEAVGIIEPPVSQPW